jgi:hypothetical protein
LKKLLFYFPPQLTGQSSKPNTPDQSKATAIPTKKRTPKSTLDKTRHGAAQEKRNKKLRRNENLTSIKRKQQNFIKIKHFYIQFQSVSMISFFICNYTSYFFFFISFRFV